MHIISMRRLQEFWKEHPGAETVLRAWYTHVTYAHWKHFVDVRSDFPSADQVQRLTVFNIAGNNYRLIARIEFTQQKVYIRAVLTHAEYDREGWKNDPWYN